MRDRSTKNGPATWRPWAMLLVGASMLVACGSDGVSPSNSLAISVPAAGEAAPEEPAPEEPAPEEPAPEEPAPEEPAPEPPAEETPAPEAPTEQPVIDEALSGESEDEGWTSDQWIVLIVVVLAVLAAVIAIAALASRRSRSKNDERVTLQRRLDDIVRGCRSIHDSAVLSILQTDNSALRNSTFASARAQLLDLEVRSDALSSELSDESQRRSLHELSQAVAGVRGALESNVQLRSEETAPGQGDLIDASNRTVLFRSEQLEAALQQVLYLRL